MAGISSTPQSTSGPEPVRELLERLWKRLDLQPTQDQRELALSELRRLDRAYALRELEEILNAGDLPGGLHDTAAKVLFEIDRDQGMAALMRMLVAAEPWRRYDGCGLLHDLGDVRAQEALMRLAANDPDAGVRAIACWALGAVGDEQAIPILRKIAETDKAWDELGDSVAVEAELAASKILVRMKGNPEA